MKSNGQISATDDTLLSDGTLYWQLVGSFIYLTITQPDVAHAVYIVSQFIAAPLTTHFAAIVYILRYVKGTVFHGLHFSRHSSSGLRAYSDVDWAGDLTNQHSITGYCFCLGDSLISWHSKKQKVVSHSTTEVEYRALANTA